MKAKLLSLGFICLVSTCVNADPKLLQEPSNNPTTRTYSVSPTNSTEIVKVWIEQTGDIFLEGKPIQSIQTLTNQLAHMVDPRTVIALNTTITNQEQHATYLNVFRKLAEMSQLLLVVEDDGSQTLQSNENADSLSTFSLSSKQFQEVRNVYRQLSHQKEIDKSMSSLGLSFSIDEESQTYLLHSLKVELPGRNLWLVGEALDEEEPEASIQWKKSW